MGYFKNLEIELQEIHDEELREIVAWHRAHKNLMTPEELWAVMTDEVKLKAGDCSLGELETVACTETRYGSCCVADETP
jgi:hypothetical protein